MATTQTVVPADPQHYVWWFPGSPVKVHLNLQVVQRLQERLRNARAGTLEEGLLLGRVRDGAAEILDFQPASSGGLPNMIAALPKEQHNRTLIGYYRTEEGDTFQLNAKDRSLAEQCFGKPHHVFLLIHSNGFGSPNATFFFHDGDRKMSDFAFLEFPFDPSLLAIEERERMQRSRQASIEQPTVAAPPAPAPPAADGPRKKRGVLLKSAGWTCAVALVFALGMLFNDSSFRERYFRIWRTTSKPSSPTSSVSVPQSSSHPSMALRAIRQNGDLEVTWNRESALIAVATSGVISIQDGESKRLVPLDTAHVRGGSLLYSPTSDQILMDLTVTTPTDTVTESVMVILPKVGKPQTYPLPRPQTLSTSVTSPKQQSDNVPLVQAPKPFAAPSLAKAVPSPALPDLQDAPAVRVAPAASTVAVNVTPQAPIPPPPTPTAPSQQPAPSVVVTYEPPVAVVKRVPAFPPELRNLSVKQTVIQVKVTIDKDGKVIKAEAIPQKNLNNFLLNSAVNTARLWGFQPARRNHVPVTSESLLEFVFTH